MSNETPDIEFFFNRVPCKTLVVIDRLDESDAYGHSILNHVNTTYAHMTKVLRRLEERDLITSRNKGRKKFYKMTDKGEQMAEKFSETFEILGYNDIVYVENKMGGKL